MDSLDFSHFELLVNVLDEGLDAVSGLFKAQSIHDYESELAEKSAYLVYLEYLVSLLPFRKDSLLLSCE